MSGPTLEGRLQPRLRSRILRLLAAVTGLLIARSLLRFIGGWVLGIKRPCSVSLGESGLVVESKTFLAGKVIRSTTKRVPPWKVGTIAREEKFRYAHVLVGAMFLLMGLGLGFALIVEWAWTQFGVYLLIALGAIVLGIAIDAAIVFLIPVVRNRSAIIIHTDMGDMRVDDVLDHNATQFLEHVEDWILLVRDVSKRTPEPPPPAEE